MAEEHIENKSICAVFVTYFPDHELLAKAITSVKTQVDEIVVVDNTDDPKRGVVQDKLDASIVLIPMKENTGIGAAHNKGIEWAKEKSFSHVLLMDQDSVAVQDMVVNLMAAFQKLKAKGRKVAAVGPRVQDQKSGKSLPFIEFKKNRFSHVYLNNKDVLKVVHLISSGSLIKLDVLDKTGLMEEKLFIDYVDIEWGLRVIRNGFQCYAVGSAKLNHNLGDNFIETPILRSRKIIVHGPVRHYYQYRNAIHLYKRSYVPLSWILYDIYHHRCKRFVVFLLTVPNRLENAKMMLKGAWHGIKGITGPYTGGSAQK